MTDRICDKIKLSEVYDRKGVFTYTRERKRREIVMKKKVVGMLLCCVLVVSLAGCGKGQESAETKGEETTEVGEIEQEETTAVDDKTTSSSDALGGVYVDGDELTSIPMGTCIDGEQVDFVYVEMPLNYIFGALYRVSNGEKKNFEHASGGNTLAASMEVNFQEEPYAVEDAMLVLSQDDIEYRIVSSQTLEEVKEAIKSNESYSDCVETTINNQEVFYYKDNSQSISPDLVLVYKISDKAILGVFYKGPLAEKLGNDQLAQNICNLITVIE